MVHFPAFFTSFVATLARVSRTLDTSDFFNSVPSASACARAPLLIALPLFIAFIGAMAASVACGEHTARNLCLSQGALAHRLATFHR